MSDNLIVINKVCMSIMIVTIFITGIRILYRPKGVGRREDKSVVLIDHVTIGTNMRSIRLGLMLEGWENILIAISFILCGVGIIFGILSARYSGISHHVMYQVINTLAILIALGIENLFFTKVDAETAKMVDFLINKKYTYIISGHWSNIKEEVCTNPIFSITENAYRDTDYILAAGSEKDADMVFVIRLDASESENIRKIYVDNNGIIVTRLVQD